MKLVTCACVAFLVVVAAVVPSSLWAQAPAPSLAKEIAASFQRASTEMLDVAEAMPADKYSFAPTNGEFKGVRIFADQIKHLAAANHILAAAALGEEPPADAEDEKGPDSIHTKEEIVNYLKESFAHLQKALDVLDEKTPGVKTSPISPFQNGSATRTGLIVEALLHSCDHYGQMVEYLRMNGVIPPASRN